MDDRGMRPRHRRSSRTRKRRLNLRRTLFLLPNLITLSSIFCGFYAMVLASTASTSADLLRAATLIIFAMFFDALDGRVARATKTQSAFGLQLDSLADVVSFGAAPALLMYAFALHRLGTLGMLAGCGFVACGAIRLARFNVLSMDEGGAPTKPSKYIVGLPIPAAAGILVGLVLANHSVDGALSTPRYDGATLLVVVALSALMVSSVRFRSFKDVKLDVRSALFAALIVGTSVVVSFQLTPAFVLVWLLGAYVLFGLLEWLFTAPRRLRQGAVRRDSTAPPAPE
jgi:CDP-diacylglycerol--serine O-phosphatidyltransferase